MSYKNKVFLIALISTISLSSLQAAESTATAASETAASAAVAIETTKVSIEGGKYVRSPIRRGERHHSLISIRGCSSVGELDATCFMNDPHLAIVSFKGSTINFSAFAGGLFGQRCPALQEVDFTDTKGIDLKQFVEALAASDLLDLILKGTCTLKINRATDDQPIAADASARDSQPKAAEIYDQKEIQTMIRAFRETQSTASAGVVWWLVSKVTGGLVSDK